MNLTEDFSLLDVSQYGADIEWESSNSTLIEIQDPSKVTTASVKADDIKTAAKKAAKR